MVDTVTYAILAPEDEADALALVLSVFETHVAPEFTTQGCAAFESFVNRDAFSRRPGRRFAVAAWKVDRIVGVIDMAPNGHVALFFVASECQGQGVGGALMRRAVIEAQQREPGLSRLTVNASPGSVTAYSRMGFSPTESEQESGGIRFIPMELSFNPAEKINSG